MPQHTILLADDNVAVRVLCATALLRTGYQVDTAADGVTAWKKLNDRLFDLLITDNDMPEMSGIELLERLAATQMPVRVIMISGNLPEAQFARCPWLKPAATLLKPFSISELAKTVHSVLHVCAQPATEMISSAERAPIAG